MIDSEELIEAARGRGPKAMKAARQLERRIGEGDAAALATRLADELDSPSALSGVAALALARSGDQVLVQRLLDFVADSKGNRVRRSRAVDAIGNLADPAHVPVLAAVLDTLTAEGGDDPEAPHLTTSLAVALAKAGDHRGAPALIEILSRDATEARQLAANALKFVVGPGMVEALQARLDDKDEDVRTSATDALFLLGDPRVVDLLLENADGRGDGPRWVRLRIDDLVGAGLDAGRPRAEFATWWEKHRSRFTKGVCYRLGSPIDLAALVPLLDDRSVQTRVREEFEIITGVSLEGAPGTRTNPGDELVLAPTARERLGGGPTKYESGILHKWGRPHDLESIFEEFRPSKS